jgi:hypothetical protein
MENPERKFNSVKEQVEKTPYIDTLEARWMKDFREDMKEVWANRKPGSVGLRKGVTAGNFDVHTHPNFYEPSFPSFQDLVAFSRSEEETKTMVIASMSPEGEVSGYTFIKKFDDSKSDVSERDFIKNKIIHNQLVDRLRELQKRTKAVLENKYITFEDTINITEKIEEQKEAVFSELETVVLQQLTELGWRMRLVPMKGYVFRSGFFVKDKKTPPESPPPSGGVGLKVDGFDEQGQQVFIDKKTPPKDSDRKEKLKKDQERKKKLKKLGLLQDRNRNKN